MGRLRTGGPGRADEPRRAHAHPYLFLTGFDAQLSERLGDIQFIHQRKCVSKPWTRTRSSRACEVIGDVTNRLVRVLRRRRSDGGGVRVSVPPDRFQVEVVNDGESASTSCAPSRAGSTCCCWT
jgi:hypothetical protein